MFNLLKKWEDVLYCFCHGLVEVLRKSLHVQSASTKFTGPRGFLMQDFISDPHLQAERQDKIKSTIIFYFFSNVQMAGENNKICNLALKNTLEILVLPNEL